VEELRAELTRGFSYPPGEPLMNFEVAGARAELSDGSENRVLYGPERDDDGQPRFHGGIALRSGSKATEAFPRERADRARGRGVAGVDRRLGSSARARFAPVRR